MSALKEEMKIKLKMVGVVNGQSFQIDGEGKGKPYEGSQKLTLEVVEGGPLLFSYDILTTIFQYGNRAFVNYPKDIPDIFKQTCSGPDGGFSWQRTMTYEDGGVCTASNHISVDGDTFYYVIRFNGENFPPNGPVMQKRTVKWEPSTEIMFERDGLLRGDIAMSLLLKGGGHYRCDFKTIYTPKRKVNMPGYHFVDHCIEIQKHDKDYNMAVLSEDAVAHNSPLEKKSQAKA
uniref:Green fluorescent protein-like protein n=1 Tax=Ricordea florida TaxID=165100 RepID=Q8T5E9_RICFL|nr:green fluorescent protein-like protein [Ricordea florida]